MWTLRWKRLLWRKNLPWWSLIPWISVLRDCQWGWLYSWLFSRWSLVILLLMILMTTLMIIGMRERPGAPIIGPAGRLADRHQPGLCHHRQLCHHFHPCHHNQPPPHRKPRHHRQHCHHHQCHHYHNHHLKYETPLMKSNLHQNLWISWKWMSKSKPKCQN